MVITLILIYFNVFEFKIFLVVLCILAHYILIILRNLVILQIFWKKFKIIKITLHNMRLLLILNFLILVEIIFIVIITIMGLMGAHYIRYLNFCLMLLWYFILFTQFPEVKFWFLWKFLVGFCKNGTYHRSRSSLICKYIKSN